MSAAAVPREPVTIGDPSRRLGTGGAVVVISLVLVSLAVVRYGFGWVVSQSDEWSLASAHRVVETSTLSDETRSALDAELDRLGAAFNAGQIDYAALFSTVQRLVEGTLVPAALVHRAAGAPGLEPDDAAAFTRLGLSLEGQDFVPASVEPVVKGLLEGNPATAVLARVYEALATEVTPPPAPAPGARPEALTGAGEVEAPGHVPAAAFDIVQRFRAYVDATLAGQPPRRFELR
ncbi:MAG: hypothetical protein R3F49_00505 [Planctomycetota bacterium]